MLTPSSRSCFRRYPRHLYLCRVVQASLAAVGLVSWGVAGVLLGTVIPFTLIVIPPTNKQLLSPALDRGSAETERVLARWGMSLEVSSEDWHFRCPCTWRYSQSGSDLGRALSSG
jgi:hypothetical protein